MILKKLAAVAASAAVIGTTVLVPFAGAANDLSNSTTGPFSTNYNSVNNTSNVRVENVSDMAVTNNVTTVANTGHNSASYSTLGGSIMTGNATNNTTVKTTGNINTVSVTSGSAGASNNGTNDTTGPFSDNRNRVDNVSDIYVKNDNTAVIKNNVTAVSDTGNNSADYNTGPSMVNTGNALTNANVLTHANDSATEIKSWPGGLGGSMGLNNITGPYSTNYNDIFNKKNVTVNNVSDAAVWNDVTAVSNSGANSASYTTLGGDIRTANATTNVVLDTTANINTVSVALGGGFGQGDENSITGPYSDNRNTINNTDDIAVSTRNNKCSSEDCKDYEGVKWGVWNRDVDIADTGNNVADYNTGPSLLDTGLAWVNKFIQTYMNDNFIKLQ